MLEAFAEEWTGRTMLIRLGPEAAEDGDPWLRQVTVKAEWNTEGKPVGTIKGYAGEATEEVLETIVRKVNAAWAVPARYLRRPKGREAYWMQQVAGESGGKVVMQRQGAEK